MKKKLPGFLNVFHCVQIFSLGPNVLNSRNWFALLPSHICTVLPEMSVYYSVYSVSAKRNFRQSQITWAAPSEFGTYRLCEQRRFRRACASAQSRQNLRCSLIQTVSQEEPSDRKPDPWSL